MTVAVINGTMLVPGVSLNNRLYEPDVIAKAVARMQERIATDTRPIILRTHHGAGDDSRLIVGKMVSVNLEEDGSATYKAQLYGTQPGKDIAALVTGKDPALKSVSISGGWLGPVRTTEYKGKTVEAGSDLEIDAVDFTASPGVVGALISKTSQTTSESAARDYTPISESYEATVSILEDAPAPTMEAKYSADDMKTLLAKGHAMKNASGDPSYPIKDRADLQKAIKAVGRGGSDHNAIRRHIIKRAKALGMSSMIPSNWGANGSNESAPRLSEIREYYPNGPENEAGFCIDAYAGPLSVTVRGCVPGEALRDAAMAAVTAAMGVFATMDPDQDADIDVGMDDDDMDLPRAESATTNTEGSGMNETEVRTLVQQMLAEHAPKVAEAAATSDDNMESDGSEDGDGAAPPAPSDAPASTLTPLAAPKDAPKSAASSHAHTHDMADGTTHTHGHLHTHETSDGPYDHTHGHNHFHLPGGDESHTHTHNHDHATDPSDTHEHATTKESPVTETANTPAAEAAPVQAITLEHVTALTAAITALTESLKPAAAEEAIPATEAAVAVVPAVTETAPDFETMKRDVLNDLRSQVLKEFGLPQRNGYRLTENNGAAPTPEQERADAWKNRSTLLLGDYGQTPIPIPGTGVAAS